MKEIKNGFVFSDVIYSHTLLRCFLCEKISSPEITFRRINVYMTQAVYLRTKK